MAIAFCIVFILIGLFFMTPAGAGVGLRWNQKHEDDVMKGPGYRAKTVPGVQITGLILVAVATFLLVKNL